MTLTWRQKNLVRARAYEKRYRQANQEKIRERRRKDAKKYYLADPEKMRARSRRFRGLPLPTRACPAACECCGSLPGRRALNLDHCHRTGKFRGWLCSKCNTAIGMLGDSISGVTRAVTYLQNITI